METSGGAFGLDFGIIFGSRWDNIVILLGSFRGHVAIVWDLVGLSLGSYWDYFGVILKSFWDHFGIILESLWDDFCNNFKIILECVFL